MLTEVLPCDCCLAKQGEMICLRCHGNDLLNCSLLWHCGDGSAFLVLNLVFLFASLSWHHVGYNLCALRCLAAFSAPVSKAFLSLHPCLIAITQVSISAVPFDYLPKTSSHDFCPVFFFKSHPVIAWYMVIRGNVWPSLYCHLQQTCPPFLGMCMMVTLYWIPSIPRNSCAFVNGSEGKNAHTDDWVTESNQIGEPLQSHSRSPPYVITPPYPFLDRVVRCYLGIEVKLNNSDILSWRMV